ncbi:MAG: hypothetical protein K6E79_00735 [Pseudobutyrivibrio sp.]|nr:hypothetical protein [Pseudobutyrivibrio sp.]
MVTTLIAALFAGCGSASGSKNAIKSRTGSALKTETAEEQTEETATKEQDLYIVEGINMAEESIAVYSINSSEQLRYNYNMTTKFLDKYGDSSSWANFPIGSVVTLGDTLPSSGALISVQKADSVWVHEDLSKYTINTDKDMITIGDSNYKITGKTKIYSDTEKILLSDIGKDDILTVIGKDKEIISIAVTTGHGYIQLTNTELFNNSLIFIGDKIVSMIYGSDVLEVPEGTYPITVANDGWGGTAEYTVNRNETTEINLEDLKGEGPSYCELTFLVTVPSTYVYIDGEMVDINEPVMVKYGNHKLVVQCAGYTSWNKTLVVNSKSATITLAMEEETDTTASTESSDTTEDTETETENDQETSKDLGGNTVDDYDYEVDYLSTISDLISKLNQ